MRRYGWLLLLVVLGAHEARAQNPAGAIAGGGGAGGGSGYSGAACTATQTITTLNGSSAPTCSAITNVSGNAATATALAANGTNCTAGNYPLGVDASGNAESCTAALAIGGTNGQIQYNNSGALGGSATTINAAGSITMAASQKINVAAGTIGAITYDASTQFYGSSGTWGLYNGSNWIFFVRNNSEIDLGSGGVMGFTPTTSANGGSAIDTAFSRCALGVACFGNGTNGDFTANVKSAGPIIGATNGATATDTYSTEQLTLATGATTTATAGNLAPATSQIESISYRITTTITTAASFTVKVTGGNAFCSVGTATTTQSTLTSGTTGVLVPCAFADQYNASATTLTVTTNVNPGAGVIRLTVFYKKFSAATS